MSKKIDSFLFKRKTLLDMKKMYLHQSNL